jgi:hypothetical protein
MVDIQYNECIKCIEYYQSFEIKGEGIPATDFILQMNNSIYKQIKKKDHFKLLWSDLEAYMRNYQDLSQKHKLLYNYVKKLKINSIKSLQQQQQQQQNVKTISINEYNNMSRKIIAPVSLDSQDL